MDISQLSKKHDTGSAKWFDDIPDHEGLRLQVRSTNFKPYKAAMKAAGIKHSKALNRGEGMGIVGKIMAEHLLVSFDAKNWTGITNGGKPLEYSDQTALMLMTTEDDLGICQAFQDAVFTCAKELAEDQRKAAQDAAGNSPATTAG